MLADSMIFRANFKNFTADVLTSRIKTVRAGARDCPQDNPLSKRERSLD